MINDDNVFAKKAEAQMRKVKDLQKWIDGYREVKTMADELELAFDFCKDDLVTEEEVDAAYQKAVTAVEALELKNMLRQEADQMDWSLSAASFCRTLGSVSCFIFSKTHFHFCNRLVRLYHKRFHKTNEFVYFPNYLFLFTFFS